MTTKYYDPECQEGIAGAAIATLIRRLLAAAAARDAATGLLSDLVDGLPCDFRGNYCMEHHEKARPGECPNDKARRFLFRARASQGDPATGTRSVPRPTEEERG